MNASGVYIGCSGSFWTGNEVLYHPNSNCPEKVKCDFCDSQFFVSKESIRCPNCGASYYNKPN